MVSALLESARWLSTNVVTFRTMGFLVAAWCIYVAGLMIYLGSRYVY